MLTENCFPKDWHSDQHRMRAPISPHPCQQFFVSIWVGVMEYLIVILICIALMANAVKHLSFHILIDHLYISFREMFAHLKVGLFVFLLVSLQIFVLTYFQIWFKYCPTRYNVQQLFPLGVKLVRFFQVNVCVNSSLVLLLYVSWASQAAQWQRRCLPAQETQEMRVWSLGGEDPLE